MSRDVLRIDQPLRWNVGKRWGLVVLLITAAAILSSCGSVIFSPEISASAVFTRMLSFKGQTIVYLGSNRQFSASGLTFIPSRNLSISSSGVTGLLVNVDNYGAQTLWISPNPDQSGSSTSGISVASDLEGFNPNTGDSLQFTWDADTLPANNPPSSTDYYALLALSPGWYLNVATVTLASQQQGAAETPVTYDPVILAGSSYVRLVGGDIAFDPSTGEDQLYVLIQDTSGTYWPIDLPFDPDNPGSISGSATVLGTKGIPFSLADGPTNGKYLYDPSTQRHFLSYEHSGTIKTVTWKTDTTVTGQPSTLDITQIPVSSLPKAVLPGGYLYVESGGYASVYDSSGSLVGRKAIGDIRLAHLAIDPGNGAVQLVFTYAFPSFYDGNKAVFLRVYTIDLSTFLSDLK